MSRKLEPQVRPWYDSVYLLASDTLATGAGPITMNGMTLTVPADGAGDYWIQWSGNLFAAVPNPVPNLYACHIELLVSGVAVQRTDVVMQTTNAAEPLQVAWATQAAMHKLQLRVAAGAVVTVDWKETSGVALSTISVLDRCLSVLRVGPAV